MASSALVRGRYAGCCFWGFSCAWFRVAYFEIFETNILSVMKLAVFGHSYVRDLSSLQVFSLEFGSEYHLEVSYFGFAGARFTTFLTNPDLLSDLVAYGPECILVILGGNDFSSQVPLSDVCKSCKEFYKLLKEKLPSAKIYATQVELRFYKTPNRFCSLDSVTYKKVSGYFNAFLKKIKVIDRLICILGPNRLSNESFYKADGVHLNAAGLRRLFEIIRSALENILRK